jgi:hypothetical protein
MTTEYIAPDTTTEEWSTYPFTVDGVQFNSKIRKDSDFGMRLTFVPAEVFTQMNISCIREYFADLKTLSRADIISRLTELNHGGTNAILELAEQNV